MSDTLVNLAYFCIAYNIAFVTYLFYKELFRAKPLSFMEIFMYIESVIERVLQSEEQQKNELKKEIFNSELRSYDRLRETIKKLKDDSREIKR